jgi:DNA-binding NarL/FixJ family response regulator
VAKTIRIMIVEDHQVVRQGLVALMKTVPDISVVAEASNGDEAIQLHAQHRPDITLMDLRLPVRSGVDAITAIRQKDSGAKIIVLTTYDGDEDIYRALQAGARGYLLKGMSAEELLNAVREVQAGRTHIPKLVAERLAERMGGPDLTVRELDVLRLIVKGKSNKEIGTDLNITEATVKTHINNILGKLGVTDRTQATTTAIQRGIVHLE